MAVAAPPPSESVFRRLLTRALDLPAVMEGALGPGPAYYEWDDFPAVTLRRLEARATLDYRSALLLLRDPLTAYSAELMLRLLTEFLAYTAWIHGAGALSGVAISTPACRGIAFEGDAIRREIEAVTRGKVNAAFDPQELDSYIDQLTVRQRAWWKLSNERGCSRRVKVPKPSEILRRLGSDRRYSGMYGQWAASSTVLHLAFLSRTHKDTGEGVTLLGEPASIGFRHHLLANVQQAYAGGLSYKLEALGRDPTPIWEHVRGIRRTNTYRRAESQD